MTAHLGGYIKTRLLTDEEQYGAATPATRLLRKSLQNYLDSFEADRRADAHRIGGAVGADVDEALDALHTSLDAFALVFGRGLDANGLDCAVTVFSEVVLEAFLIGAGLGSDMGRAIAQRPLKDGGGRGGRKSVATRQQKAETGWKRLATPLAQDLLAGEPGLTREKLAFEVAASWKSIDIQCVGHRQLLKHLNSLEARGELVFQAARRTKPLKFSN